MANTTGNPASDVQALTLSECMYVYRCQILRVLDGDTVDAEVDLGFSITTKQRFRIFGVNSPEKDTPEGVAAREFVAGLLYAAQEIHVQTMKASSLRSDEKKEKFGRYLVNLVVDGRPLSEIIIEAGHGKAYFGGKRD